MLDTPILFLIFNRPDTTATVFEEIRKQRPKYLFVAADGPRDKKSGEAETCKKTREVVTNGIDWDCELKLLFRDRNLGCGHAVCQAITWFFEQVEEGIILEDDTLPDPSFFNFCEVLLEKYRYDDKIKMISGDNFQGNKMRCNASYYFTGLCHIWGWATWKRTWNEYDFSMEQLNKNSVKESLKKYFNDSNVVNAWYDIFNKVKDRTIDTWDFQLAFSIWEHEGVNIVPQKNLVSNIGFGFGAVHTTNEKDQFANMRTFQINNIIHPLVIEINKEADSYVVKKILYMTDSFFKKRVKAITKKFKKWLHLK